MAKNKDNTTSIGFEDAIWRAADKLRGNLNAAEYEGVVLGLIFLKYISDKFDAKFQELSQDEYADVEDKDEYEADGVFFVPQDARWSVISQAAHTPQIGKVIDDALEAIERENTKLKGVLPSNYARPELDKRRLGDVVDLFTNIHMLASGDEKDLLGRVYEYCLQKFASMEGKNAGEFYTPSCIVRTIVEILQPYAGRVYDPCCGSGGMFVQSAKFIRNHQKDINNISVYGQEANPSTWKMAHMNVAIRGLEANLGKSYADTFFNDQHPTLKADFIMANPPFNLSDWGADKLEKDVRWKFGIPPSGNANFAWMQHMIHHLSPTGRIGLVLANGALSSQTGGEGTIRQNIVEADLVEGIIALPSQLFYSTGIPVSLWFLSRNKQQPGKVLFVDARNMGTMVTRAVRELMPEDITKIASTFEAFRNGTLEDEAGFCAVKTLQDIAAQDFILTPGRYVGIAEQEDDGEPFAEKMERLTSELSDLFAESHRLEDEIKKQLGSIEFEIK
ncbi:MAG: SAM-dependent DNA methyltransferase [Bacteroidaceae bacterium]|nr:SAM-dependent DNA methyltransferase [Bacteroidaceae bacterium]